LILQIIAAIMAVRLMGVIGNRTGWACLAAALLLMAARRGITLLQLLRAPAGQAGDPIAESVALTISVLAIAGMILLNTPLRNLQRSHSRLTSLVNPANFIIWEVDLSTMLFTFVSPQVERMTGYPAERWLHEKGFWADHIHPEDRDWAFNFCVQETKHSKHHDFVYRMIAADGRVLWIHDVVTVVSERNAPAFLRGVMIDVTAQKEAEAALANVNEDLRKANEKLRELDRLKTEFLATISHELRTPLAATGGAVENFVRGFPHELSGKQRRLTEIIGRNIKRLAGLVDNLLDLSQIEVGRVALEPVEIDLREPVGLAIDGLRGIAAAAGRTLSYEEPADPMVVHADPDRVMQIVTNLIDNAIRFAEKNIRLSLHRENDKVTIAVENDGAAFAPDMKARLFERFAGAGGGSGPGHLGLGLSVVKALAEAHGGETSAENLSAPEKGVRFLVRIPTAGPPAAEHLQAVTNS
jgi:PAS domain S-box-containing protein